LVSIGELIRSVVEFLKNRDLFLGALLGILLLTGIGLFYLVRQLGNAETAENENRYRDLPIQNWRSFSSTEGEFSITFPGIPETTNLTVVLSTGNTIGHLFYANCGPQNSFAIEYEDSAKFTESDVKKDPQEFLKKAENLSLPEAARIVFEQQSIFDGYPAREFEYAVGEKGNYSVRYKMILAGERFYVLYVIFLTANPHPADRAIFFNSLSLN
jgi:hypothetical protein